MLEDAALAPYAARAAASRGRRFAEPAAPGRSDFQRDRDRIIHSAAFRRLEYKTQVFVNTECDLYRTRLTHSLEVAQIARSIARQLRVNEDLTEAIALAHDLGHTPFGHAGQDALNDCMAGHGGFEHNVQSLRIVDHLEEHYAAFDGLNLCFETREGILKHCSPDNARRLGDVAERFLTKRRPLLEAQIANLADEIAYNNHDMDDGLRSGLITLAQARQVELFERHHSRVCAEYPELPTRRQVRETVRRIINTLIVDVLAETRKRLAEHAVTTVSQVRELPPLVAFSAELRAQSQALKHFLMKSLYRHHHVLCTTFKAKRIVRDLFAALRDEPGLLPPAVRDGAGDDLPRRVADYIAGMTDRYAIKAHGRLFDCATLAGI
ncbi:MAG: deoxyguanosinetriphosphate triphosphohydrolase [Burkholderiaceae bacterium]